MVLPPALQRKAALLESDGFNSGVIEHNLPRFSPDLTCVCVCAVLLRSRQNPYVVVHGASKKPDSDSVVNGTNQSREIYTHARYFRRPKPS